MPRDWNKVSAISTLAGVFITSAIGVVGLVLMWWIYKNPILPPQTPASSAGEVAMPLILPWWMPTMVVAAIVLAGVLHIVALRQGRAGQGSKRLKNGEVKEKSTPTPKLKIYSAFLGAEGYGEVSVLSTLDSMPREGISFLVDNSLLPNGTKNPAPSGVRKRLTVKYSYGDSEIVERHRWDGLHMTLPVDDDFIWATCKEYDDKCKDQIKPLRVRIQELEKPHPATDDLIIKSARYGPDDESAWEDVTLKVYAHVKNNAININVSRQLFPERIPRTSVFMGPGVRVPKYVLEIMYTFGSAAERRIVRYEGDQLQLPEPSEKHIEQVSAPYPHGAFTLVRADLDTSQAIPHLERVSIILTNKTSWPIEVWTPVWRSTDVQLSVMPGYERPKLQLEAFGPPSSHTPGLRSGGWRNNKWGEQVQCLDVKPGETFLCWLGFAEPSGEGVQLRLNARNTGIALFPVKINGELYEEPVKL
ncbi:MAG: hypothetical protein ABSB15_19730 [Bryobacteraceae bacterium]|jgi:hypothetical protein